MDEEKLGICPFCGEEIIANNVTLLCLDEIGIWYLQHFCCHDDDGHHVCISVSGKTKEEVIERCRASLKK